jgi:hypothetical protein
VLLNDLLPAWAVLLLLVSLLVVTCKNVTLRGLNTWAEERQKVASANAAAAIQSGPVPHLAPISIAHVPSMTLPARLQVVISREASRAQIADSSDEDEGGGGGNSSTAASGGGRGAVARGLTPPRLGGDPEQPAAGDEPPDPPRRRVGPYRSGGSNGGSWGKAGKGQKQQKQQEQQQEQHERDEEEEEAHGGENHFASALAKEQQWTDAAGGSSAGPAAALSNPSTPSVAAALSHSIPLQFPWIKLVSLALLWLGFLGLSALDALLPLCSVEYIAYLLLFLATTLAVTFMVRFLAAWIGDLAHWVIGCGRWTDQELTTTSPSTTFFAPPKQFIRAIFLDPASSAATTPRSRPGARKPWLQQRVSSSLAAVVEEGGGAGSPAGSLQQPLVGSAASGAGSAASSGFQRTREWRLWAGGLTTGRGAQLLQG